MQLLSGYIQYRKLAQYLITTHPLNHLIILRTTCATLHTWLLVCFDKIEDPTILDFLTKLEYHIGILVTLEIFYDTT